MNEDAGKIVFKADIFCMLFSFDKLLSICYHTLAGKHSKGKYRKDSSMDKVLEFIISKIPELISKLPDWVKAVATFAGTVATIIGTILTILRFFKKKTYDKDQNIRILEKDMGSYTKVGIRMLSSVLVFVSFTLVIAGFTALIVAGAIIPNSNFAKWFFAEVPILNWFTPFWTWVIIIPIWLSLAANHYSYNKKEMTLTVEIPSEMDLQHKIHDILNMLKYATKTLSTDKNEIHVHFIPSELVRITISKIRNSPNYNVLIMLEPSGLLSSMGIIISYNKIGRFVNLLDKVFDSKTSDEKGIKKSDA